MIFDESSVFCSIVKWVWVVAERVEKNETLDNPLYFNSWRFLRNIDGDELKFEYSFTALTTIEQKFPPRPLCEPSFFENDRSNNDVLVVNLAPAGFEERKRDEKTSKCVERRNVKTKQWISRRTFKNTA